MYSAQLELPYGTHCLFTFFPPFRTKTDAEKKVAKAVANAKYQNSEKGKAATKKAEERYAASGGLAKKQARNNAKTNPLNNPLNNPFYNKKTSDKLDALKRSLIQANKDHTEATISEEEIDNLVTNTVTGIRLENTGFVHVYVGARDVSQKAIDLESFGGSSARGDGIPSVVNSADGSFATLKQVQARTGGEMHITTVYSDHNMLTCDLIEKALQTKLLSLPPNSRMFRAAGKGTCRPKDVEIGTMFPCYCAILTSDLTMAQAGLRLGTQQDRLDYLARRAEKKAAKRIVRWFRVKIAAMHKA